jgi:hypothetical protein
VCTHQCEHSEQECARDGFLYCPSLTKGQSPDHCDKVRTLLDHPRDLAIQHAPPAILGVAAVRGFDAQEQRGSREHEAADQARSEPLDKLPLLANRKLPAQHCDRCIQVPASTDIACSEIVSSSSDIRSLLSVVCTVHLHSR